MAKNKVLRLIHSYILVAIGTFVLAFGSVVFLAKCELVSGGISGIAIIIQHYVDINVYDYAVAGLMVVTWLIGLLFLPELQEWRRALVLHSCSTVLNSLIILQKHLLVP